MRNGYDLAERRTGEAAIAGVTHGVLLAVLGLLVLMGTDRLTAADLAPFGYVALVLGLSYGVARRSRAAAGMLLALVLLMEGAILLRTANLLSIATLLLACPCYLRGLLGALEWHRLERQGADATTPSVRL